MSAQFVTGPAVRIVYRKKYVLADYSSACTLASLRASYVIGRPWRGTVAAHPIRDAAFEWVAPDHPRLVTRTWCGQRFIGWEGLSDRKPAEARDCQSCIWSKARHG